MNTKKEEQTNIIDRMNDLVESIISFNDSIQDDSNSSLRYFLNEVAQSMPNYVQTMIKSKNVLNKRKSFLETKTSLDEAKVYLSLIQGFGYGETKDLSIKVDEFNKLLSKNFS